MDSSDTNFPMDYRCGTVAIIGRPNVGKSTLLNHLVGQKISITSRKPQTTRTRLKGIVSQSDAQFVFVDTPGYQTRQASALHRAMNRSVLTTLQQVDVLVMVVVANQWNAADQQVLSCIPESVQPILVINKVDQIKPRSALLPFLERMSAMNRFSAIVPLSARHDRQFAGLLAEIRQRLPISTPMFPDEEVTDSQVRFLAAEFIREQLVRLLGEELPYVTSVMIEQFEDLPDLCRIHAVILVENANQKAIVIGDKGSRLKSIGMAARQEIEKMLDKKVYLNLWVKPRKGWSDNERVLKELGYDL